MIDDEYKSIIRQLPKILLSPHDEKGGQYLIWYCGNWVIKKPQWEEAFTDGRRQKAVDPHNTMKKLGIIKEMKIDWLNIPETYINKKYDVLIQRRIYGTSLDQIDDPNLFVCLKTRYDHQKKVHGLSLGNNVLQKRNLILDKKDWIWLVDPD